MVDKIIDLRSDTITLPSMEMRESILHANLGDDILGEDPTVQELEELTASLLGMEAGLLVISGTMANQVAVMSLTERGQEIIVGKDSHIYNLEVAGLATLSQVQVRAIDVRNGYFNPEEIEQAIQTKYDIQRAETGMISLENTYNLNMGQVVTLENMAEIKELANKYDIPVFLDGARLFNAATYLGVKPAEICKYTDAVQICLTKGLGAPLGSILLGSKEFIHKSRRIRQRLGGGMRQAGIIAAPGIIALNKMVGRLQEDHSNALKLAKGLADINGLYINPEEVQTNIVSPTITREDWNTDILLEKLNTYHIKVKKIGYREFRMITHLQVSSTEIDQIVSAFREIFQQ